MRTAAIIPLYNKESAIVRTLTSVRLQTVPVDEIIVVNDGSTDGSEKAALSVCDARIRIVTTANHGESHARNYAAAMAGDADVLLLLDADDEWHPQFVETILGLLSDFPAARAAATGYQYQLQDDSDHVGPQAFEGGNRAAERLAMRAPGYGHHQHTVDRDSHLQWLGEAEERRRVEDHEIVFRAGILQEHRQLRAQQIGSSPGWRTHGQNIQGGKFRRLCQWTPPGRPGLGSARGTQ